jgi:hypothetical protein
VRSRRARVSAPLVISHLLLSGCAPQAIDCQAIPGAFEVVVTDAATGERLCGALVEGHDPYADHGVVTFMAITDASGGCGYAVPNGYETGVISVSLGGYVSAEVTPQYDFPCGHTYPDPYPIDVELQPQ